MRNPLVDWVLLVVPGVIWGASFLFIAEGLAAVAPNGVTFTRILIGFLTLSLFPSARKPVARADWAGTAALGVLWFAFPLSMFPFAEQHVSSALTGMLNGATPLFVAAVAGLIAHRFPDRGTIAGLIVGFGGAVVMAIPAFGGSSSAFGVGLIVAALISYGFALNVARPLQQRNGAIPVIWRSLGVALLLTAPLGLPEVLNGTWSLRPALAMLGLGAGGTAIATILTATAAGRMGATKASVSAFIIPVVALILGVIVRGEHVAIVSVIGAAICLLGAAILRNPQILKSILPGRLMSVGARI
ncbi:MAG TPA: DMT family transporter [Vicinamibacterales bacterium]|nr:DMT family transporter [Vicinamibacterales bacterium]